jgi:DNA-binding beta-propeller fold protein YncE
MQKLKMYTRKLVWIMLVVAVGFGFTAFDAAAADLNWSAGFPKFADGKVLLMWDTMSGADSYKVYRKRGTGEYMLLTTVKVNRHIDPDAKPGNAYTYRVVAVKGGAELAETAANTVTIATEKVFVPLAAPVLEELRIRDEADGSASVGIRWEVKARASELAGYNVYRGLKDGGPYELAGTAQTTDFNDTGVKRGNTYYYVVTAIDTSFNETKYSASRSIKVPVVEMRVFEKKKPTAMRRAKHLFDIQKYKEKGQEMDFEFPVDVVVDETVGHIYVLSNGYGGVLVYDMKGKFQFGFRRDGVGSETKIASAHGLALGPDGLVYIANYDNSICYAYDFTGKQVKAIDVNLELIANLKDVRATHSDVAVNSMGDVYLADPASNRIHVYDSRGKHRFDFGPFKVKDEKKEPKFNGPGFVAMDSKDNFYMIDTSFGRLLAYDADGNFLKVVVETGIGIGEAGKLFYPAGISVDKDDYIYVANGLDPNIQAFDLKGNFIYAVANEKLDGPIKSTDIRGIYVDSSNRLYVTEVMRKTVAVYQLEGEVEQVVTPSRVEN